MPDYQSRLQPCLGLLDLAAPCLHVHVFESGQSESDSVVVSDVLLALFGLLQVVRELLHGLDDPLQQMPGPLYVSGYLRHVPYKRWCFFVLLIVVVDVRHVFGVVVEYYRVLRLQVVLKGVSLQNSLELLEQVQTLLDVLDAVEALVDEPLQIGLQLADVHIELYEVSIESIVAEVQQVMPLVLELHQVRPELVNYRVDSLQLVLPEHFELLDGPEHVHQLVDSPTKQVELPEDLVF